MTHLGKLSINKIPCIINYPLMPLYYSPQVSLYSFFSPLTLFLVTYRIIWTSILFKGSFLLGLVSLVTYLRSTSWPAEAVIVCNSYLLRPMFYTTILEGSTHPSFIKAHPFPFHFCWKYNIENRSRSYGNIFFTSPVYSDCPCSYILQLYLVIASHFALPKYL